jgi:N-acetylglucosamine kinase-like BadF-type ATPase
MSKYILGVDGGGTKSQLALFNESGKCVNLSTCGTLNHECMAGSFEELGVVLPDMVLNLLKKSLIDVSDLAYGVFGIAGADTKAQHRYIAEIIQGTGIGNFTLYNDAFLGVAAGCPDGVGICAINGTGSTMAALDYSDKPFQLGGMGLFTDDCGGSTWYGEQVIGEVYNSLYKKRKPTLLKDMLFEHAFLEPTDDYLEVLIEKIDGTEVFMSDFNRFVFEAAAQGDETAFGILKRSAEHYAGGIAYLAESMDFPHDKPLHVVFAGSVFVKEKVQILPTLIKERVGELLNGREAGFFVLDTLPVAGAVLWAAHKAGFDIEIGKIKEEIGRHI